MAVTVTTVKKSVFGDMRVRIVDITMDSSYATGGETLSAGDVGLKNVVYADVKQKTVGTTIRQFQYDIANGKILAFQDKDPASAGGADAPFPEVANATNLSTITVRGLFIGN